MRYINQSFRVLLPALLAVAMLASCNDTPTTIGSDYLPTNVEFGSYALKPEDFQIISGIAAISNSAAQGALGLTVGQAADGTVAHGLMAITSESPVISGSAAKPVTAATLILYPLPYRYGDTAAGAPLSFDVVVLDEVFSINAKWDEALVARIAAAPSLGSFSGTYPSSEVDSVMVMLDAATTQQFLQGYFRYDTTATGREFRTLKSLALRSHNGGRLIGGFFGVQGIADSLHPTLRVQTADTVVRLKAGTTNWIVNSPVATGENKLVVMGGLPVRSLIKLRLDSIPVNATIHQAELRLYVDKANTHYGTFGEPNYLVAYVGTDTSLQQSSYLLSSIAGLLPVPRPAIDSVTYKDMFRFTALAPTIAAWLRNKRGEGPLANNGVILAFYRGTERPDLETTTVDRVTFFGPDATNPALRPALTITYSVQVDANK